MKIMIANKNSFLIAYARVKDEVESNKFQFVLHYIIPINYKT
jgi:hypothetical protein